MHLVHTALWLAALGIALAGLVLAGSSALTRRELQLWIDRAVLVFLGVLLAQELIGLLLLAAGPGPADPLHLLYGLAVVLAVPLARYLGAQGTVRRRATVQAAGWAVSLGLLVRLFMTG